MTMKINIISIYNIANMVFIAPTRVFSRAEAVSGL